jgi:putative FmdB family regulatory protein
VIHGATFCADGGKRQKSATTGPLRIRRTHRRSCGMPLRDYTCRACQKTFEALVKPGEDAPCPACASTDVERKLALFARPAGGDVDAAPSFGGCGTCGDPRGPGACRLDN